jgi:hypothetical protein
MSHAVFERLTSAPYRRRVEIGEGTHSPFLEKNRWQVFGAVDQFLTGRVPANMIYPNFCHFEAACQPGVWPYPVRAAVLGRLRHILLRG